MQTSSKTESAWVDRVQLITPDNVLLEYELAGPTTRLLALLADLVLQVVFWVLLIMLLFAGSTSSPEGALAAALMVGVFAVSWGYSVYFEVMWHGQTPGKMMAGIRVVRSDGMPVGLREASLRTLLTLIDSLPAPSYLVGGIAVLRDPQSRRVGDMVAGTVVIRESKPLAHSGYSGAVWAARAERGQANQGLKLPGGIVAARKLAILEQFWERRGKLDPNRRIDLAEKLMQPLWALLHPQGDRPLGDAERWIGEIIARAASVGNPTPSEFPAPQVTKRGPLF